ncbi:MAG: SH3 domain-containing protein [Candidatus Riflebacteria bacterium]|nr:SH3 domain-containing protein [Candidatus Riflebacteria bacterium]
MKKVRMVALLVVMVSIVGLGLFFGAKAFHKLEERSASGKSGIVGGMTEVIKGTPATTSPLSGNSQPVQGGAQAVAVPATAPGGSDLHSAPVPVTPGQPGPGIHGITGNAAVDGGTLKMAAPVGGLAAIAPGQASETVWAPASGERWFAYAAANATKVRENPGTTSKALMQINLGTRGLVLDRKDGWTKVKWDFNRKIGWTRDDFLTVGPAEVMMGLMTSDGKVASISSASIQIAAKKAQTMANTISMAVAKPAPPSETVKGFAGGKLPHEATIIADPNAHVRSEPSTKGIQVGKVAKGSIVTIKSVKKIGRYQWFEIIFNNGKKEGWTREDNLQF